MGQYNLVSIQVLLLHYDFRTHWSNTTLFDLNHRKTAHTETFKHLFIAGVGIRCQKRFERSFFWKKTFLFYSKIDSLGSSGNMKSLVYLTQWDLTTHKCIGEQDSLWFRWWLVTSLAPGHYLNQWSHCLDKDQWRTNASLMDNESPYVCVILASPVFLFYIWGALCSIQEYIAWVTNDTPQ